MFQWQLMNSICTIDKEINRLNINDMITEKVNEYNLKLNLKA